MCSTLAGSSPNVQGSTIIEQDVNISSPISSDIEPVLRSLTELPLGLSAKQAWLETLSCIENKKLGLLELHPDIFATYPRVDILWKNIRWQERFRKIDYRVDQNRAEMRGGGRKPWPQKGTGRARHGSVRSPIFIGGGKVHGNRGPLSLFYMLPLGDRVRGLRVALTFKHAQNNLHIVDSLDLPTSDPKYLEDLVESRGWGLSVLFVDDTDVMPENISIATSEIKPYNIMPLYGLNVFSMLKHETLVITKAALEAVEMKLLKLVNAEDHRTKKFERVRGDVKWQ